MLTSIISLESLESIHVPKVNMHDSLEPYNQLPNVVPHCSFKSPKLVPNVNTHFSLEPSN